MVGFFNKNGDAVLTDCIPVVCLKANHLPL